MSDFPELDLLGRRLSVALERELPRRRRRRRAGALGLVVAACVAVPATGAVTDWAGLAGGQTALPTQVDSSLRVRLLGGADALGPWRLEAYRAQQPGGGIAVCVFVTRDQGGTGRCVLRNRVGPLVTAGQDPGVRIAAGVVSGQVAEVEVSLRLADNRVRTVRVRPSAAPEGELARRGLPKSLRPYAVALRPDDVAVQAVRALATGGQSLAQDPPVNPRETP